MFTENSLLHFIEADIQDVVAMYRSTSSVMLSHGSRQRQSCEAFICVTNDGDSTSVHVALSLIQSRNFVVFVPERQPSDKESTELVLKEAQAFVKGFGFEMQGINLNYSKALKEVILNDLRVVRSATAGKKASQRKGPPDKSSRAQQAIEKELTGTPSGLEAKLEVPQVNVPPVQRDDLIAEKERKTRLGTEKAAAEKAAARTLASLRADNDRFEKEIKAFEQANNAEIALLKTGIEELGRQKTAAEAQAEKKIAQLQKESQRLSGQIDAQHHSAAETISALATEIEKLTQDYKADNDASSLKIAAAKAEIESLLNEKTAQDTSAAEELAALQRELEQLSVAKTSAEKDLAREIAVLKTELEGISLSADLGGELESLQNEIEHRRADKSATESRLQAEVSELRQEIATLEEEISSLELKGNEEAAALKSERKKRALEKEQLTGALELNLQTLRSEIAQLEADITTSHEAGEAELAVLTGESKRLLQIKTEADQARSAEILEIQTEIARLEDEKKAAEEGHAATVAELKKAAAHLAKEKTQVQQNADQEQQGVRDRIALLQEEIAVAREAADKVMAALQLQEEEFQAGKKETEATVATEVAALEEQLSRLKVESDVAQADSERKICDLKDRIEKLSAERISSKENAKQQLASLREQDEQLTRQLADAEAAAADEVSTAQLKVTTLRDEVKIHASAAQEKKTAISAEIAALEEQKETLLRKSAEQLFALKGRVLHFTDDLLASEKELVEKTSAARNLARSLLVALNGENVADGERSVDSDLEQKLAALQQEAEKLVVERNAFENATGGELVLLRTKVASLAAEKIASERAVAREKEALQLESERLVAEKVEMEKAAKEELAAIRAEVEQLAVEKAACEKSVADKVSAATAGVHKIAVEKEALERLSAREPATLPGKNSGPVAPPQEIAQPTEAPARVKKESLPPVTQPFARQNVVFADSPVDFSPGEEASSAEVDETDPFAFLQSEDSHDFRSQHTYDRKDRKSSSEQATFTIDTSKKCVDYLHPEDVLEIYKSLNRARVAMGDNTTETCDAFVFSLQENGTPHVYIALYLVDRKDILVYVPEQQPANDEDLARVMADGFDFIEIVGFLMDPMDLGHDAESRRKILGKVPVLQRIDH
jgi:hypothetical protein